MTTKQEIHALARLRLSDIKRSGIRYVKVLGFDGMDGVCPLCQSLVAQDSMPIESLPSFPPKGCFCKPWCRCTVIAVEAPQERVSWGDAPIAEHVPVAPASRQESPPAAGFPFSEFWPLWLGLGLIALLSIVLIAKLT